MTKKKYLILILIIGAIIFLIPNIANAAVGVTKNVYSNNGSTKFNFTGLTLNTTHEYEFGLTKTAATQVETWHLITEYTASTATIDIITTTSDLRDVVNAVNTGYITIKDKTEDTVVLQPYAIDLKIPFLKVTNYTVLQNGKEMDNDESKCIQIGLRNATSSNAYYQYEKITDTNVINKYKGIKSKNGDFTSLQSSLKSSVPQGNWNKWQYWNGYGAGGMNGFGYPTNIISAPDTGLYYLWVYFSGKNIKDIYGYILVDNLQPDIALDGITLAKTANVELGKTLTLKPTFNPSNATNKIVTWTSSDESVATVDNAGKVTPKKIGSTMITVTSQDGSKKATCTVTVVAASTNNSTSDKNNEQNYNNKQNSNGTNSTTNGKQDSTTATGSLPHAGAGIGLVLSILGLVGVGTFTYFKYNKLRDVK